MHKIFSFKGITRNGDPLVADEGECIKVVNMRMKDGVYVPVPRPEVVAELRRVLEQCKEEQPC